MAGYSGTPLVRKIGVESRHVVLLDGAPDGFELALDERSAGAHVVRRLPARVDVALTFHAAHASLARRLPVLLERTAVDGMVWVCWPKKAAQRSSRNPEGIVSDLDENRVRDLALGLGVVDVKVAAIDETWSGLKLVRRLADR